MSWQRRIPHALAATLVASACSSEVQVSGGGEAGHGGAEGGAPGDGGGAGDAGTAASGAMGGEGGAGAGDVGGAGVGTGACPVEAPAAGSPCSVEHQVCSYPGFCKTFTCNGGEWTPPPC